MDGVDLADVPAVDHCLGLHDLRIPTAVEVDAGDDVVLFCVGREFLGFIQRFGQRLFADNGDPALHGVHGHLIMRGVRRADVYDVRFFNVDHFLIIVVALWHAVRRRFGHGIRDV